MKLTFLHTGAVHIPVFEQMLEDYDHGREISHLVGEEFLTEALARGGVDSSLKGRIQAKVSEAIEDGANLVWVPVLPSRPPWKPWMEKLR